MIIYIYPDNTNETKKIIAIVKQRGFLVLTEENKDRVNFLQHSTEEKDSWNKVQGVILEGSRLEAKLGYLTAYAIAKNKPILYLIQKGNSLDEQLKYLEQEKDNFKIKYYSLKSLEKVITHFLRVNLQGRKIEKAKIKFTLRLTATLEQFLIFKAKQQKTTKAKLVRKFLEKLMGEDKAYRAE